MTDTNTNDLYYIGDLSLVLDDNDWLTFCAVFDTTDDDPENYLDPDNFDLDVDGSGRPFAALKTAYGDGVYTDREGNSYSVDSGTIGLIKVSDILDTAKLANALNKGLGHLHDMGEEFYTCQCGNDNGVLYFGDIVEIDTN
jgi:hypothetical protein